MVDKPWLQKDKEIRNPYYGAAMIYLRVVQEVVDRRGPEGPRYM